ncbi:MAG: MBL fold metallo-hydrolase [Proteobacteria bacterium]|nr:MBL fold metallo-hydrolase [Pseudomonadota bacterium]
MQARQAGGSPGVITIVYDNNRPEDAALRADWGFACVVDYAGRRVLFDTGADGDILLRNMKHLGIDPSVIDAVVISHSHWDHTGGLKKFLAARKGVPVHLLASFPPELKDSVSAGGGVLREASAPAAVAERFETTGEMGVAIREQALVVKTPAGLVVVTGCAHPGIAKIVEQASQHGGGGIALVVGGFHLKDATGEEIEEVVRAFRRLGVKKVAPCHCTGEGARGAFAREYGEDFIPARLGTVIRFIGS